jgi:hypothetical protein
MKLNAHAPEFIIPISQNEESKVDSQKEIEELKKTHQKEIDKLNEVHLQELKNEKLRFQSLKHNQKILTNRLNITIREQNEKIEKTISNCFLIESEQDDILENNLNIQITKNKELRQHIIYLQKENNDFRLRLEKKNTKNTDITYKAI